MQVCACTDEAALMTLNERADFLRERLEELIRLNKYAVNTGCTEHGAQERLSKVLSEVESQLSRTDKLLNS